MKKIAFTIMLLMIVSTGFSQSFSFGPKAGANVSNYTGGNFKSDALVGFHLGGLLNFGIGSVFSIQPEVLFSTQGAKIPDNSGVKTDYKVSYVSVPVMLRLKSRGGFYIEAGPQASFKTGENVGNQTINNFAKGLDLAAGAGLGFQTGVGFGVGARYVAGLSKVGDFSPNTINPDFKNSVIQVSLFFAIPASK